MSTYAIGDIQGCYDPLQRLLAKINYDPSSDKLWFTGDLVNRGPESLKVLRFIKSLGTNAKIVLGNHDLHLLALGFECHPGWAEDTLVAVLTAPDRHELLNWLLQQPLLYHDSELNFTMVHAGLAPSWDLTTAQTLANEVGAILQSNLALQFFQNMYGNEPNLWQSDLQEWDRLRCIVNYFTRARFCHPDGSLELGSKGRMNDHEELIPWFKLPGRVNSDLKIIFGHWAALGGITGTPNTFALDTGCVWGFNLTAMRLEDEERFSVGCK